VNIADFGIELDLTAPTEVNASFELVEPELTSTPMDLSLGETETESQAGGQAADDEQPLSVNILEPKHVVQLEDDDPTVAGELYETPDGDLAEAAEELSLASSEETQIEVEDLPGLVLEDATAQPDELALPDLALEASVDEASEPVSPDEDVLLDLPLEVVGRSHRRPRVGRRVRTGRSRDPARARSHGRG
jgi:hypothetical protein